MTTEIENERKRQEPSDESNGGESVAKRAKVEGEVESTIEKGAQADAAAADTKESTKKANPNKRGNDKRDQRKDTRGRGGGRERVTTAEGENGTKVPRLPKRKVGVAFGYCGTGYSGLQINEGVKTIEGDIFAAFCKLGAISEDNAVNPNKVGREHMLTVGKLVHQFDSFYLSLLWPGRSAADGKNRSRCTCRR
jgi:tRNA pseudouridine38-40 synthase